MHQHAALFVECQCRLVKVGIFMLSAYLIDMLYYMLPACEFCLTVLREPANDILP